MKRISVMKVLEFVGWGLAAVGTIMGGFFGTRNAVQDEIEEIRKKGEEAEEEES